MATSLGALRFWTSAREDTWTSALLYLAAAVALGQAIQLENGAWSPQAIGLLTLALVLCLVGVARPSLCGVEAHRGWLLPAAFALALGLQLWALLERWPASYLRVPAQGLTTFYQLLILGALACGVAVGAPGGRWARHGVMAALVGSHLAAGAWILAHSPAPWVDVHFFHRSAMEALLSGESPYGKTIPDIYGHGAFYGADMVRDGRVLIGFPYPPLSALLSLPGAVLAGDHRWSALGATSAAALLMGYARPGLVGALAAAVFLFTPRGFFVLEHGWTEPFVVLLLALAAFTAVRSPRAFGWAVALLLSIKQYVFLGAPAVLLAAAGQRPFRPWRLLLQALAVGAALLLPFLLWEPRGLWRDVFSAQFGQPFRMDALSFLAHLAHLTGERPSASWAWVAVLAVLPVVAARAPRSASGMCGAFALILCVFFAFNKQAFANYYYLVIGALCCAVALTSPAAEPKASVSEAPPSAPGSG